MVHPGYSNYFNGRSYYHKSKKNAAKILKRTSKSDISSDFSPPRPKKSLSQIGCLMSQIGAGHMCTPKHK